MKELKELIKKHKKIEVEIKHLTKLRLNDRSSSSWEELRKLKKEKLLIKEKINKNGETYQNGLLIIIYNPNQIDG